MSQARRLARARDVVLGGLVVIAPSLALVGSLLVQLAARRGAPTPAPGRRPRSWWWPAVVVGSAAWWWGVARGDPLGPAALADAGLALQTIAVLLVGRTRASPDAVGRGTAFATGAALGVAAMAAVSLPDLLAGSSARAGGWYLGPNTWAHAAVLAAALVAAVAGRATAPAALAAVALAGVAVAASGSRGALVAWGALVGWTLVTAWLARARRPARARWLVAVAGTVAALLAIAVPLVGQRIDALARFTWWAPTSSNLVIASEELVRPYWTARTATVATTVGPDGLATHVVASSARDPLARVHQTVNLPAGAVRTLSVDVVGDADPGVVAFGAPEGRIDVDATGRVRVERGPVRVLASRSEPLAAGVRLHVTVRNDAAETIAWSLGLAPSLAGTEGGEARFRRITLADGAAPAAYDPTTAADRVRALAARSSRQRLGYVVASGSIWRAAPWWGHGTDETFETLARRHAPGQLEATDRPPHAHLLWTDLLVTRGLLGTAGFVLAAVAFTAATPPAARRRLAPVALALLVANTFDVTLWGPAGAVPALSAWVWVVAATSTGATGRRPPARGRPTAARTGRTPPPAGT